MTDSGQCQDFPTSAEERCVGFHVRVARLLVQRAQDVVNAARRTEKSVCLGVGLVCAAGRVAITACQDAGDDWPSVPGENCMRARRHGWCADSRLNDGNQHDALSSATTGSLFLLTGVGTLQRNTAAAPPSRVTWSPE